MPGSVYRELLGCLHFRPARPEPLFYLANYFIVNQFYLIGYLISRHSLSHPIKDDFFYSEPFIYEYGLLCQLAASAAKIGRNREARDAYRRLCQVQTSPRKCVRP